MILDPFDSNPTYYRNATSSHGTSRQEIEANAFAAALLMPKYMIEKEIEAQDIDLLDELGVTKLAGIFRVSVQAVTIRLIKLNIIEPIL